MSAALLMLAAALVVAPWSPPASDRLQALVPRDRAPRRPALATAAIAWVRERLPDRSRMRTDPAVLAHVVDLLAVSLLAGLSAADAVSAVAAAVGHHAPAVARPLRAAAARMRLGATPQEAWTRVPGGEAITPVAALLARATGSGGSVRAALDHAAARMRTDADAAATARAERASVLVAGPLGLCFLPAFVCLGVLPVVIGLADGMLPGPAP